MIKLSLKYHQNTIKISSKHVGTRQKIKLQSAEGGRHPLGNALKSSMYAAILAVTAFPYGRSQKLTPPVDLKKCNFIQFYQVFFCCYSKGEQIFFKIFFSAVSTNFCIFSSGALKTQRDLLEMHKKKFFKNFFEVEKNSTKSDFSDFAPKKNFFSRRFSGNFASRGRDRDVFYRSVKKKSENSSIEARSSRAKKRGRFA